MDKMVRFFSCLVGMELHPAVALWPGCERECRQHNGLIDIKIEFIQLYLVRDEII